MTAFLEARTTDFLARQTFPAPSDQGSGGGSPDRQARSGLFQSSRSEYRAATAITKIIAALDQGDDYTRSVSITALQNLVEMDVRSIPEPVQVFSIDYDKPEVGPGARERLGRALASWKARWEDEGRTLLEAPFTDRFKMLYWSIELSRALSADLRVQFRRSGRESW